MTASSCTCRGVWSLVLLVCLASFGARSPAGEPPDGHHRFTATLARLGPDSGGPLRIDVVQFSADDARGRIVELLASKGVDAVRAELGTQPSLGYVWTAGSVGYLIKYAVRLPEQDGSERWLLATDRLLGSLGLRPWQVDGLPATTALPFTLIELRLPVKGTGEGRLSIGTAVVVDSSRQSLGFENAPGLPVTLMGVRRE